MAYPFVPIAIIAVIVSGLLTLVLPGAAYLLLVCLVLAALGTYDRAQRKHAVLRNFPVIGRFRYLLESIRPEINQYFIESNTDGTPFNRELRSLSYQRAKRARETVPFGTQRDVYESGYEWINHSLEATRPAETEPRVTIGEGTTSRPYEASLLNISAMSFGSLSDAAVRALNGGARIGKFYHNTGEGSISRYHLEPGGDLVWQIGTGYFGCRNKDGSFDPEAFADRAAPDAVRMIEIKLSQGAKPGHGGILPAAKITKEIAGIRGVPMGYDVVSPPAHSAFSTPKELLNFVVQLRELSNGKPVGIKLCLGHPAEFLSLCKAMHETGHVPDFISVDGGEGGTGAAPLEFSNSIGAPLTEGLYIVHAALTGFGLRQKTKIIASGKIITGFHMASRLAAGADLCNAARGFMFALGCIQARRCNSNVCPVGVATQDRKLIRGLDVEDKTERVASYHHQTVHAFLELLAAAGLRDPAELRPWHIQRRVSAREVRNYAEIYAYPEEGSFVNGTPPEPFAEWLSLCDVDHFRPRR
ncbi:MAG: FMN-binding glutamate synthase family protein [Phycisphaerae bacterium]